MRNSAIFGIGALALLVGLAPAAQAQSDTLKKLQDFKTTGTSLDIKLIDQGGAKAAALRANLEKGQAAGRLQDRSLCHRARRPAHGGRHQCRRGFRRHPQD